MRINIISAKDWEKLLALPEELLKKIGEEIFIVKEFIEPQTIDKIKKFCVEFSSKNESSWNACIDGCPDYHRIHNNYARAHVRSVQHAFYYHPWNANFNLITSFGRIGEVFELKARLMKKNATDFAKNIPSTGPIARIVCHQYPRGGGWQSQHIDPVTPFAKVQTIIQASSPGKDYLQGGVYVNDDKFGVLNIDALTDKGDLLLMSPGIKHGVSPIDQNAPLDWSSENGRWIIMPIIINSDYEKDLSMKPRMSKG